MGVDLPPVDPDEEIDAEDVEDETVETLEKSEDSVGGAEVESDSDVDDRFEMNLLGGFTLLKDSRDPLSVMLGVTNILTTLVLLWSSYHVGAYSIQNDIVSIPLLLGLGVSMLAAGVLISEILADGELAVIKKIRKRARPLQYLSLLWLWILWFLLISEEIPLERLTTPVEVVQTMMTAFVILEFSHRITVGKIVLPKGNTLKSLFQSSVSSVKTVVTTTELNQLRDSSEQLFSSFRLVLDGVVVMTILSLLTDWNVIEILSTESWLMRLLAIYAAMFISQIITRARS